MADRIVIMRDGVIQQIADPATMFSRPANLFVAGFIGSPGMNFVRARRRADGRYGFLGAAVDLPQAAGTEAIVGVRPEHLSPGAGAISFEVRPALVEGLGSESYVYFDAPGESQVAVGQAAAGQGAGEESRKSGRMIARLINAAPVKVGETLTLSVDPARLHVFDAISGQAVH